MEWIAWPGAVIVLGGAFMLIFRTPVSNLLGRVTKIDKSGLSAAASQQIAQAEKKVDDKLTLGSSAREGGKPYNYHNLMESAFSPSVAEAERITREGLNDIRLENDQQRESLLIRTAAWLQVQLRFLQIDTAIYGSQLSLLLRANGSPTGWITQSDVNAAFEKAKTAWPDMYRNNTVTAYVNFLLSYQLLRQDGEHLSITQFGKDYMKYLIDAGKTHPRFG